MSDLNGLTTDELLQRKDLPALMEAMKRLLDRVGDHAGPHMSDHAYQIKDSGLFKKYLRGTQDQTRTSEASSRPIPVEEPIPSCVQGDIVLPETSEGEITIAAQGEDYDFFASVDHRTSCEEVAHELNQTFERAAIPVRLIPIDCGDDQWYWAIDKQDFQWSSWQVKPYDMPLEFKKAIMNRMTRKELDELSEAERDMLKRRLETHVSVEHVVDEILKWEGIIGYTPHIIRLMNAVLQLAHKR